MLRVSMATALNLRNDLIASLLKLDEMTETPAVKHLAGVLRVDMTRNILQLDSQIWSSQMGYVKLTA